jgi:hypothetical protein
MIDAAVGENKRDENKENGVVVVVVEVVVEVEEWREVAVDGA